MPATGSVLRDQWHRLLAMPGAVRRAIAFRLACRAATMRPPAWWVRLCDRAAARRERIAWWWEGYQLRTLRPLAQALRYRVRVMRGWCADVWNAFAAWCYLRTAPLRAWYAERAADAARRSDDLGERLTDFKAARITPALQAVEDRLPRGVDTRRVKEGLFVLRNEWEKSLLAASLLIAASIIWWNWRIPAPPPPSPAELTLVRSFTAHAPKKFDFSKLINLPKEPAK